MSSTHKRTRTHAQGYKLYVDGVERGVLAAPQRAFDVSGGGPINLDSAIVLCGRSDSDTSRYFDGRIAHFSVFDGALTPEQARARARSLHA